MRKQHENRNLSMVMDFYEMTMANGYFAARDTDTLAVFDVFYRKNPDNAGFAVFAGLEQIIEYINNLHFDEDDIAYLRSQNLFSEEFLEYLRSYRFHGDIYAMPEGTVIYPNEPLVTVVAPLLDAQLIETALLREVNHQSLIATKANRIVRAAKGRGVSDFGARRAHNVDAAVYGARAAYIGGVTGTATVLAGEMFQIPISGTMAHSWVMFCDSEYEAFKNMRKPTLTARFSWWIPTMCSKAASPMQSVWRKKFWSPWESDSEVYVWIPETLLISQRKPEKCWMRQGWKTALLLPPTGLMNIPSGLSSIRVRKLTASVLGKG